MKSVNGKVRTHRKRADGERERESASKRRQRLAKKKTIIKKRQPKRIDWDEQGQRTKTWNAEIKEEEELGESEAVKKRLTWKTHGKKSAEHRAGSEQKRHRQGQHSSKDRKSDGTKAKDLKITADAKKKRFKGKEGKSPPLNENLDKIKLVKNSMDTEKEKKIATARGITSGGSAPSKQLASDSKLPPSSAAPTLKMTKGMSGKKVPKAADDKSKLIAAAGKKQKKDVSPKRSVKSIKKKPEKGGEKKMLSTAKSATRTDTGTGTSIDSRPVTTTSFTTIYGETTEEQTPLTRWIQVVHLISYEGIDHTLCELNFKEAAGYIPNAVTKQYFIDHPSSNRFEDIICIDQTRVLLSNQHYIHASWVQFEGSQDRVILTQLPIHNTATDFWRMVIEYNVGAILLILTAAEYDLFDAKYAFPEQHDFLHFGDIRVGDFQRANVARGWQLRVLSVKQGAKSRFIHVHLYTEWPHRDVPDDPINLWRIQSVFRRYPFPHAYVSLSGCGRAGTFATLETMHRSLHDERCTQHISVVEGIRRVREQRMHAVQAITQYHMLQALVLEHIMGNDAFHKKLQTDYPDLVEQYKESRYYLKNE
ncbi:hypothetical protein WR25_09781 [Diploscapter pachys]|uniref:Tyrosine-protein phosphatase domain-containing protein n=1 Tax=Diploscapter pachys TaxID=2018661 RepID=A0A2A2JKY4_9BILA|nr:hypothetical protein WR25_09781 [Diploscapter pachys]